MTGLLQDFRFALRTVRTMPGFAAAVITLSLGIGGTTATFSVIDAVLLRPLAFADADRLVRITADFARQSARDVGVSVPELEDYRALDIFEAASAINSINANLIGGQRPERLEGLFVSGGYFAALRVSPARGRLLGSADELPGIGPAVVISHTLWQRQFGQDERTVGRIVRLDGDSVEIVGILPADFRHPGRGIDGDAEFFLATTFVGPSFGEPSRSVKRLQGVLARLEEGVSIEEAERRLHALGAALRAQHPEAYPPEIDWQPRLVRLDLDVTHSVRPSLWALAAAVASVLLIACANVANLLMARGAGRRRELAVRTALGATRARVVRQLLTESLVLSAIGGASGLLVAQWLIAAATSLLPDDLPITSVPGVDVDVFLFAAAVSLLTGALFGTWPALSLSGAGQIGALSESARSFIAAPGSRGLRNLLVVGEVAVALVLLICAGLLLQSFVHAWLVDPGFRPDRVLAARTWMPLPNDPATGPYSTHEARVRFYRALLDRLSRLPGVEQAGFVRRLPLISRPTTQPFLVEGKPLETALQNSVEPTLASPGYFGALGIGLVRGRLFTDDDTVERERVLLVSESFARRYFPGDDAIGKRIRPGGLTSTAPWFTIVGVVQDVRAESLDRDPEPQSYRCIWQSSDLAMALVLRTSGDPMRLEPALRAAVQAIDPDLPVFGVRPMETLIGASLAPRRFAVTALGAFAALALLLSVIGLYGLLSYLVRQRTAEIGLRMALGAAPVRVLMLVLAEGATLVALGIGMGLAGAAVAARSISGMLFRVPALDIWTFATQAALLGVVALVACWIPARRAVRLDPLAALRGE